MKRIFIAVITLFFGLYLFKTEAQNSDGQELRSLNPDGGDTLKVLVIDDIYVYPSNFYQLYNEDEKYRKMVRDIKKTLPYAKLIYHTLIETYEYIMTFPTETERQEHLKRMEKELFAEYKPVLKRLTVSQGKLLIKLIDRECNQSSYDLLKAFLGSFRAGFWNFFAGLFGASLKIQWEPDGQDADKEKIVLMIEQGIL
ncbi:MAG: DUF4294 domain-containing protein [Prevotellaceae bacterium]|jgi:hypothetical protein|nr:DUF4294 domain-containing protein [Prevotellaceae bacterium]